MKHRHSGPKVQYTTKKGNIKYRKRPIHNITRKKMIRKHLFFPREEDQIEKTFTKEGRYLFPRDGEEDEEEGRRGSRRFIRLAPEEEIEKMRNDAARGAEREFHVAYVLDENPNDIFIANWPSKNVNVDQMSDVITHEELHRVLANEIGLEASKGLDVISAPRLIDDNHQLINPKTAGEIFNTESDALVAVDDEIGGILDEYMEIVKIEEDDER